MIGADQMQQCASEPQVRRRRRRRPMDIPRAIRLHPRPPHGWLLRRLAQILPASIRVSLPNQHSLTSSPHACTYLETSSPAAISKSKTTASPSDPSTAHTKGPTCSAGASSSAPPRSPSVDPSAATAQTTTPSKWQRRGSWTSRRGCSCGLRTAGPRTRR